MRRGVFVSSAFFDVNLFHYAIPHQRPTRACCLIFPSLINLALAKLPFALSKMPARTFDDRVAVLTPHVEEALKKGVNPPVH
jgi:hypothetical protein